MTTYVLGAGASVHAGYPLADELGNKLYEWLCQDKVPNRSFRMCVEALHETYGSLVDFEKILTELDECPTGSRGASLSRTDRKNISDYVRYSIPEFFNDSRQAHASLYKKLAQYVCKEDVIITFNYDVALERELKRTDLWEISNGYGFDLEVDGIPPSNTKIFKLHGSTSWFGHLFGGMPSRGLFQFQGNTLPIRPVILRSGDFKFLGYPPGLVDPLAGNFSGGSIIPALIMPGRPKRFFIGTPTGGNEWEFFWKDLWGQAGSALQSAEKIIIIGYSMPVVDEEARKLLLEHSNRNAEISIFCGRSSEPICNEFRARGFTNASATGNNPRFEDFLACSGHPAAQTA